MGIRKLFMLSVFFAALYCAPQAFAQKSATDTILLGAIIENGDTIGMVFLPEFVEIGKVSEKYAQMVAEENKLRYNVYVVYPYAVVAGELFKEMETNLDRIPERRERKKYLKSMEKRLDACFKKPLKDLSIDQGHILVKLVNRQAGANCYSIIRELKNGLSAVVWQSVGLIFGNNLNGEYDPTGEDKDIEKIVRQLEASNNYHYMITQQTAQIKAKIK